MVLVAMYFTNTGYKMDSVEQINKFDSENVIGVTTTHNIHLTHVLCPF